jgi:hypothetical protein
MVTGNTPPPVDCTQRSIFRLSRYLAGIRKKPMIVEGNALKALRLQVPVVVVILSAYRGILEGFDAYVQNGQYFPMV